MALEFASKMKPIEQNPNLSSGGHDNAAGLTAPVADPGFVFVEEVACSFQDGAKGKRAAGAVYIGTGGSAAVLPSNKSLNSANLMVFKNIPDGSFLPIAANKIAFTAFDYVPLGQELKTLITTNNFLNVSALQNKKGKVFVADWYRVISSVKTQIGRVELAITFESDVSIAAVRLFAGYDWNKGNNRTNTAFNLDFAAAGDTLEIDSTESSSIMSADVVFTLTSNEIKNMPGTTATDIIAYR
jgi:hypothetical protein|tara:strand:+ start:1192 stop:1917 length:726 start_codon:yes stop_codon:yes gene_type:complete